MQRPPKDKRYEEAAAALAVLGLLATLIAVAVWHFLSPILEHLR